MRWLIAAIALLTAAVPVLAGLIDFEDDFDSYGTGIECASDPDTDLFIDAWPVADGCGSLVVDDSYYGTCPDDFKGSDPLFYVKHGKELLRRNIKDLVPYIQIFDPSICVTNPSLTRVKWWRIACTAAS